jgi:putative hemolysin
MESDERKPSKIKTTLLAPIDGINKLTGRMLGKNGKVTEESLLSMVDAAEESGLIEEAEADIINKVIEFDEREVRDVMTHRVNVIGIKAESKLNDIVYVALDEGFSRLPVYRENLDDVIGIIIVKDLLSMIGKDESEFVIDKFIREAEFVPESKSCGDLFKELKAKKAGMAIVIDEYGGTAGIVTMEDLIEEIIGSIQDEYDEEEAEFKQIGDEKYEVEGDSDPEEVLKLFGYELPDDHEYETLAGFVTDLLGFIPTEAEQHTPHVDYHDLRFVVREMENHRIGKVLVYRKKETKVHEKKT